MPRSQFIVMFLFPRGRVELEAAMAAPNAKLYLLRKTTFPVKRRLDFCIRQLCTNTVGDLNDLTRHAYFWT